MLDKRIVLTSWGFKLDNGVLKYKEEKIDDIEKEIEKMSNEEIKHFEYFLENYNKELKELEKNKAKVKNFLQNKTESLNASWSKLKDLRKKEANEIKKETIKLLKKLDKELKEKGKWAWVNICTVEFFNNEEKNGRGDERIILKWEEDKGLHFITQRKIWSGDVGYTVWENENTLYLLNKEWDKYKNLSIDEITNKIAEKIAKFLPTRIAELTNDYQEDIINKKMVLMKLKLLS